MEKYCQQLLELALSRQRKKALVVVYQVRGTLVVWVS